MKVCLWWKLASFTPIFALRANFVQLLQFYSLLSVGFYFGYCLWQLPRFFKFEFSWGNHVSVAESSDTCGIHHRRIIWSSYRKLAWVVFEPSTTTSEFWFYLYINYIYIYIYKYKYIYININIYIYIYIHINYTHIDEYKFATKKKMN